MPAMYFSHITPAKKLALIGELWESLDRDTMLLISAQSAEIQRRVATLDQDIKHGIGADALEAELDCCYA